MLRNIKKIFKQVVKAAKKMSNNQYTRCNKYKSTAVWSVVNSELGIKKKEDVVSQITLNGSPVVNPARMAESFNGFS